MRGGNETRVPEARAPRERKTGQSRSQPEKRKDTVHEEVGWNKETRQKKGVQRGGG